MAKKVNVSQQLLWTAALSLSVTGFCVFALLSPPANWMLITLSFAGVSLLIYPFYRGIRTRSLDLFEPPVLTALLSFDQLLRPLYWMTQGRVLIPGYLASDDRILRACTLASLWVCIGVAVYYVVYYRSSAVQQLVSTFPQFGNEWPKGRYWIVVAFCFLAGLAAYAGLMRAVGGLAYFLSHIYIRQQVTEGLGPIAVFVQLVTVGWLVSFCRACDQKKRMLPQLCVGVCVAVFNATLGGRGFILYPVLVALIVRHYVRNRIRLSRLVVIAFMFVSFAVLFREIRDATANDNGPDVNTVTETSWSAGDIAAQFFKDRNSLDTFAILIDDMPRRIDFQLGKTWLHLLTLPIPSKLWTHKPIVLEGRFVSETYFGDKAGSPPGFAGVLFLNFYYPGVILGFVILAVFHKALYHYLGKNQSKAMSVCLYATIVTTLYDLSNLPFMLWLFYAPFLISAFWFISRKRFGVPAYSTHILSENPA